MRITKPSPGAFAAALLALLLLTFASAWSSVMQTEMALAAAMGPLCGVGQTQGPIDGMTMPGMAMDPAPTAAPARSAPKTTHGHPAACPYCAAAAHAPILGAATLLPRVTAFVFAPFRVVASLGPRGPPAFTPNARGPPPALLTP